MRGRAGRFLLRGWKGWCRLACLRSAENLSKQVPDRTSKWLTLHQVYRVSLWRNQFEVAQCRGGPVCPPREHTWVLPYPIMQSLSGFSMRRYKPPVRRNPPLQCTGRTTVFVSKVCLQGNYCRGDFAKSPRAGFETRPYKIAIKPSIPKVSFRQYNATEGSEPALVAFVDLRFPGSDHDF